MIEVDKSYPEVFTNLQKLKNSNDVVTRAAADITLKFVSMINQSLKTENARTEALESLYKDSFAVITKLKESLNIVDKILTNKFNTGKKNWLKAIEEVLPNPSGYNVQIITKLAEEVIKSKKTFSVACDSLTSAFNIMNNLPTTNLMPSKEEIEASKKIDGVLQGTLISKTIGHRTITFALELIDPNSEAAGTLLQEIIDQFDWLCKDAKDAIVLEQACRDLIAKNSQLEPRVLVNDFLRLVAESKEKTLSQSIATTYSNSLSLIAKDLSIYSQYINTIELADEAYLTALFAGASSSVLQCIASLIRLDQEYATALKKFCDDSINSSEDQSRAVEEFQIKIPLVLEYAKQQKTEVGVLYLRLMLLLNFDPQSPVPEKFWDSLRSNCTVLSKLDSTKQGAVISSIKRNAPYLDHQSCTDLLGALVLSCSNKEYDLKHNISITESQWKIDQLNKGPETTEAKLQKAVQIRSVAVNILSNIAEVVAGKTIENRSLVVRGWEYLRGTKIRFSLKTFEQVTNLLVALYDQNQPGKIKILASHIKKFYSAIPNNIFQSENVEEIASCLTNIFTVISDKSTATDCGTMLTNANTFINTACNSLTVPATLRNLEVISLFITRMYEQNKKVPSKETAILLRNYMNWVGDRKYNDHDISQIFLNIIALLKDDQMQSDIIYRLEQAIQNAEHQTPAALLSTVSELVLWRNILPTLDEKEGVLEHIVKCNHIFKDLNLSFSGLNWLTNLLSSGLVRSLKDIQAVEKIIEKIRDEPRSDNRNVPQDLLKRFREEVAKQLITSYREILMGEYNSGEANPALITAVGQMGYSGLRHAIETKLQEQLKQCDCAVDSTVLTAFCTMIIPDKMLKELYFNKYAEYDNQLSYFFKFLTEFILYLFSQPSIWPLLQPRQPSNDINNPNVEAAPVNNFRERLSASSEAAPHL